MPDHAQSPLAPARGKSRSPSRYPRRNDLPHQGREIKAGPAGHGVARGQGRLVRPGFVPRSLSAGIYRGARHSECPYIRDGSYQRPRDVDTAPKPACFGECPLTWCRLQRSSLAVELGGPAPGGASPAGGPLPPGAAPRAAHASCPSPREDRRHRPPGDPPRSAHDGAAHAAGTSDAGRGRVRVPPPAPLGGRRAPLESDHAGRRRDPRVALDLEGRPQCVGGGRRLVRFFRTRWLRDPPHPRRAGGQQGSRHGVPVRLRGPRVLLGPGRGRRRCASRAPRVTMSEGGGAPPLTATMPPIRCGSDTSTLRLGVTWPKQASMAPASRKSESCSTLRRASSSASRPAPARDR